MIVAGAIRLVRELSRSTPAGCSSISISFGAATAASVPSKGRYANATVVNAAMATPAITAQRSADEKRLDELWECGHI